MDQQPYDLFDIDKGTDKIFFIFNESFKHVYADNWLSYYLGSSGEDPVFMPNTRNVTTGDVKAHKKLRIEDERTFHILIHTYNEQKCNYSFILSSS